MLSGLKTTLTAAVASLLVAGAAGVPAAAATQLATTQTHAPAMAASAASSASSSHAPASTPVKTRLRVGSYNIKATMPAARAERALYEFLPHVDVAGLQEFGGKGRKQILRELAGWGSYRPASGGPPVVWDTD